MPSEWDNKKPTAQMLGRWQPFHDGHYALFEEIIKKTGQVCIQIRDVQGVDDNPFDFETVKNNIEERLIQNLKIDLRLCKYLTLPILVMGEVLVIRSKKLFFQKKFKEYQLQELEIK